MAQRKLVDLANYLLTSSPPEYVGFLTPFIFERVFFSLSIEIPQILKERPKKAFKRSLKEMLLDILETEDSYIDVDTIIVKMKK